MTNEPSKGNIAGAVANAGLSQLIDVVDQTSKAGLEAIVALEDAGVTAVQGATNVADKTFDATAEEVEKTRAAFMTALRKFADAVVAPLNAIG